MTKMAIAGKVFVPGMGIIIDIDIRAIASAYATLRRSLYITLAIAPSELWIYRDQKLHFYHFSPEGYQEVSNSRWFPDRDLNALIPRYIERGWEMGSSVAMREFEEALRSLFQP